jgi:hypothetical protein
MTNEKSAMERLTDETRIKGATRMFAEDKTPESVSDDDAQNVISAVRSYIDASGITRAAIAKSLSIAGSTLGSVLNGNYIGQWQKILIDLDRWLEEQQKRDAAPKASTFVWTKVAQEIRTVADIACTLKTIGLVYGPNTSGIGKTMALNTIAQTTTGAILVTAEEAVNTKSGFIRSIARAMRLSDTGGTSHVYNRVKEALSGTSRLLIIDQVHSLCHVAHDAPLFMLADLFDATKAPQLWCGTEDMVEYLDKGQARGRSAMAQIRRRIGICRDLMQRCETSGGDGEPLFTVDEIRAVFSKNKMRLAPDAVRYLGEIANLIDSGSLGTCVYMVRMATKINGDEAMVLTAAMLRSAHKLLVKGSMFSLQEDRLAALKPGPMMKVG